MKEITYRRAVLSDAEKLAELRSIFLKDIMNNNIHTDRTMQIEKVWKQKSTNF